MPPAWPMTTLRHCRYPFPPCLLGPLLPFSRSCSPSSPPLRILLGPFLISTYNMAEHGLIFLCQLPFLTLEAAQFISISTQQERPNFPSRGSEICVSVCLFEVPHPRGSACAFHPCYAFRWVRSSLAVRF